LCRNRKVAPWQSLSPRQSQHSNTGSSLAKMLSDGRSTSQVPWDPVVQSALHGVAPASATPVAAEGSLGPPVRNTGTAAMELILSPTGASPPQQRPPTVRNTGTAAVDALGGAATEARASPRKSEGAVSLSELVAAVVEA